MPGPFYKFCFPGKFQPKQSRRRVLCVSFRMPPGMEENLYAFQIFSQYTRTVRSTKNSGEAAMFIRDMRFHASRSR